ncbi:hypothetical protein [Fluviispira multicolorata]|nr:hypothetical protein [Fluviispira multicolorata]
MINLLKNCKSKSWKIAKITTLSIAFQVTVNAHNTNQNMNIEYK